MPITQFPASGYNFQAKTPKMVYAQTAITSSSTAVSVTGSGLLTGIALCFTGTAGVASIQITLDGVDIYNGTGAVDYSGNQTITFPFAHKFNSTMVVKHNTSSTSGLLETFVTYILN